MDEVIFLCWSADDQTEADAQESGHTSTRSYVELYDFECAAESFAERVFSDWDYPKGFNLFVMRKDTRETHFVHVSVEPEAAFHEDTSSKDAQARELALALTAPGRWAEEVRPRPWGWERLKWEREHPEEVAREKAALEARAHAARDGRCPWTTGQPPETWDAVEWPEWVPESVRQGVSRFWGERSGSSPADYERSMAYERIPRFGEVVTLSMSGESVTGRYVHAWNNIGRVVDDAGNVHCVSTCDYGISADELARRQRERRASKVRAQVERALKGAELEQLEAALGLLQEREAVHG